MGHAAGAAEPRLEVLDGDADVVAQARLGVRPLRDPEQVARGDVDVLALAVELVRRLHVLVEDRLGDRDEPRVRDPGAVVPVGHLAELVGAHLGERGLVRLRVVLDRDLRGHAAHGVDVAAVAGLDEELHVRAEEPLVHRDVRAVRHDVLRVGAEPLDGREDVVPAAAVEARGAVAQLPEDLVHLERGRERLDEAGRLDRATREAEPLLAGAERLVPDPRLEVALELGAVEVRPAALREEPRRVVPEVDAEVPERGGRRLSVHEHVLLEQVPAARAHHQDRGPVLQPVAPAVGRGVLDRALHRVPEVHLALGDVAPGGGVRVLEVRHEHVRAGVQRVDDHLAVHRAGDLDAAILEVLRERRDGPVPGADVLGRGEEVGPLARVVAALHLAAALEELLHARAEAADEVGDERERLGGEHLRGARRQGTPDLHPGRKGEVRGLGLGHRRVLRGKGCRDLDQSQYLQGIPPV